jgi:two-component system, chemotaxis family, chemotaxis protein CheY
MATILVVDDDASIRRMLVRILAGAGHEVTEAKGGREALRLFRAHHPAIIITDILMPEGEGIETIATLRREAASVAIIAMSGGDAAGYMGYLDFASKLGADATLAKPFRPTELIAALDKVMPR